MQKSWATLLSWALLVLGVLVYIGGVSGLLFDAATPASDVGLVSTSLILVLFGGAGLLLARSKSAPAA